MSKIVFRSEKAKECCSGLTPEETVCKHFIAVTRTVPVVGERCECLKIEYDGGIPTFTGWCTSQVKKVENMGNNIYNVTTKNNIYTVLVG